MKYVVNLTVGAQGQLAALPRPAAAEILAAFHTHLVTEPLKESKSRIKRLRGTGSPEYRLRIGKYRAYYDVDGMTITVTVVAVLPKDKTFDLLAGRE